MVVKIVVKKKVDVTDVTENNSLASIDTRSWTSTNVTETRPKTRRAKAEQIVVNDIFRECSELTTDQTWRNIFNEASYGKLPRGFSFKDGHITHKIRNKTSRIELNSDPKRAIDEAREFFKEKAGIMSQDDLKKAKEEFEEFLLNSDSLYPSKWSEIRKKKVKDVLISSYICKVAKELNIDQKAKEDLRNKIYLGFILGCFGNDNIQLEEGYIKNITGIDYDNIKKVFNINYNKAPKQSKKSRRTEKAVKTKTSFYTLWIKFLETLEKRVSKSGISPESTMSSREDEPEASSIVDDGED